MTHLDRRTFLSRASLLGGLAATAPYARAARSLAGPERTLVLLQLSGGNDGLSTVVPYADDKYRSKRKALRHDDVLKLDDYRGLHPSLELLKGHYDAGRMAIVEGVGYPQGIRSHFKSLEVWHTGHREGRASGDGWVGKLTQATWPQAHHPELVVHLGSGAPYSVYSTAHPAVALESPTGYRWFGEDAGSEAYALAGEKMTGDAPAVGARNSGRDAALARLRGVLDDAQASSVRIRAAAATYRPSVTYPRTLFGAHLRDIAALIHGDLGSRVLSTTLGGFDTHADQRGTHDQLMAQLDGGLGAFLTDLQNSEAGRATLVLVFSEFGRRVEENASRGTDHGLAGPAFVFGHGVRGGLYGEHPALDRLQKGDLVHTTDFRSVYGTVIDRWLGGAHDKVLGASYPALGFLA